MGTESTPLQEEVQAWFCLGLGLQWWEELANIWKAPRWANSDEAVDVLMPQQEMATEPTCE